MVGATKLPYTVCIFVMLNSKKKNRARNPKVSDQGKEEKQNKTKNALRHRARGGEGKGEGKGRGKFLGR